MAVRVAAARHVSTTALAIDLGGRDGRGDDRRSSDGCPYLSRGSGPDFVHGDGRGDYRNCCDDRDDGRDNGDSHGDGKDNGDDHGEGRDRGDGRDIDIIRPDGDGRNCVDVCDDLYVVTIAGASGN
ncbi:uncharacterized protein LOC133889493 [Phragmites australis]|uniref:uncharacterized protein LOC133889493 n=1 Tax=Phragmites australis TaxID=29695 RepID=UPI002D78D7FC|nr:uncharacterized protein LOC133889493 [Phragmites australis]